MKAPISAWRFTNKHNGSWVSGFDIVRTCVVTCSSMLVDDLKEHGRMAFPLQEEAALARKYRVEECLESRNTLLSTLYYTVIHVTDKVAGDATPADTFDDLLSAGLEGATTAIKKFNPDLGVSLRTFASKHITGAVMREISSRYSALSVPHNAVNEAQALSEGRSPDQLGITAKKAFSLVAASQASVHLDGEDYERSDELLVEDLHSDDVLWVTMAVEAMSPDVGFVACHYHGLLGYGKMTKAEISRRYGLTAREINNLLNEASDHFRSAYFEGDLDG